MKNLSILLLSLLLIQSVFSFEVNRNVLTTDQVIEFENYVGPHLFYNTVDEIRSIGSYLSERIIPDIKGEADYSGKYSMYHRPKLEWEELINSCDVFEITEKSLVDNIENIKLILSQYLIDSYGYSLDDSNLLAQLLVVYNAVYRGDADHYSSLYTSEGSITTDISNLGIDKHYYNWPGKTFIYIPLSKTLIPGKLATIDTDNILDSDVIDYIKENEEDEITFREEIVEYKEREFDEVKEDLDKKEADLIEEKKDIELKIEESPEDKKLKTELEEVEAEIEELKEEQKDLEKKEEKILELRDEIAEDKNEDIVTEAKTAPEERIAFILNRKVADEKLGQIIYINASGKIITNGEVNTVRNNRYYTLGDFIYFVAGEETGNRIVSIGKISKEDLKLISWGDNPCYENSRIYENRGFLYCIIPRSDDFYIGEFSLDMKLIRISPDKVEKDSYIVLKDNVFYIQGDDNSIKLVNLSEFVTVSGE